MAKCYSAQPNFLTSRIPFTSSPQLLCAKTTQHPCMNDALLMEVAKLRTTVYTIKYWCQMTFWNLASRSFYYSARLGRCIAWALQFVIIFQLSRNTLLSFSNINI